MGRAGKLLVDLIRFQAPVIDDALSLLTLIVVLLVFVGVVVFAVFWPLWHLLVRPLAAARGFVSLSGYDYVVRGWKAKRGGDRAGALKAYNHSMELFPHYLEADERRETFLAAHPELARPTELAHAQTR
jgi:hypothetical protein